jgi:protocatechuate 3,4-dioxygenase beta subunit
MPLTRFDRRQLILGAGALGLSSIPILTAACAERRPAASGRGRLIAGDTCPLTPSQTEGPFYFDSKLLRSDIKEGRPGVPLLLRVQVVGAEDCTAFANARVDVWHCDSAGIYSGYDSERSAGQTFLRGTQRADAQGVVSFATIYPGWYEGRATHIHCKAIAADGREVTSQFYFPDELSDAVYRESAYAAPRGGRRMANADDGIFRDGGDLTMLQLHRVDGGYQGAIVVALD